jgi:hypothetical protein
MSVKNGLTAWMIVDNMQSNHRGMPESAGNKKIEP